MPTITLIHGDCYQHVAELADADFLLSDPPYGINYRVSERRNTGEGLIATGQSLTPKRAAIVGDGKKFDPTVWVRFGRVALFGANHFSSRLPDGGRWIIWDKRRDSRPDDHSDCEMIWTNVEGADRIHRQKWRGVVREGEENCSISQKLHPNQKPVALLRFVLEQLGAERGHTIVDPFMGSGSTGVAALRLGMNFIGCEIDADHFRTAQDRLAREQQGLQFELMA